MAVPYTFGSATTSIPLSQLDSNFATAITLGNTAIQLGNTVTTLNNMTLGNVTISSGTSNIQTNVANATGVLLEANGGTGTTTGYYGFKNRIINGAMVIDQRNAGASVTTTTTASLVYTLDRWAYDVSVASKFTVQQNAGSVTPPIGFTNYLGATSTSAYSVAAGDYLFLCQPIEGYNMADLAWGTANAKTITLSFQVYSSLTGTFGGVINNAGFSYSYPFTYSIPVANTWTSISITIAGPTAGTWTGTNTLGMRVVFGLGVGSTYSGTAGSWSANNYLSATGATSVVGTNGATFYITGVQLEKGSTATSFDYRPYGTELALCQRYYEILGVNNASARSFFVDIYANATNIPSASMLWRFSVTKRSAATVATIGTFTTNNITGAVGIDGTPSFDSATINANPASAGRAYYFNNANSGFYASAEL